MWRTWRTSTAYSMVAEAPPGIWPCGGTMLPTVRHRNISPGSVCRMRSGTTRESAQVMKRTSGCWLSARRWKWSFIPGKTSLRKRAYPWRRRFIVGSVYGGAVSQPELRRRSVPVNNAAFHDKDHAPNGGDVLQGISFDRDDVRIEPRRDRANPIGHTQRLCAHEVGGDHRIHGLDSTVAHAMNEILRVAPVRAGDRIGAVDNFQPGYPHRAAQEFLMRLDESGHRGKAFLGVVRGRQIQVLELKISFKQQPRLRIEVRSALGHEFQILVRRAKAVLDFGAAGKSRGADRVAVGMHERAQALLLCFVTGGSQLLLRHGHGAAGHATGSVDFDEIGAGRFLFADEGANLVGGSGLL